MAIIFEEALKKNIQHNTLLPVYILYGNDGYLKKLYTEKISKLVCEKDDVFNYCNFSNDCDLQEIYDFALQLPLMSDKKYAELCDYDFERCSKNDFDKLCSLLAEIPESCVFILRFDNIDFEEKKNSKFKKLVDAAEKSGGVAVKLDHRQTPELVKMLSDGASKRGCTLDGNTARYIVETVGEDINLLKNELLKLTAFVGKGEITKATVDKVSIKTVEASIYNLSKFILSGNSTNALSCLDELLFMRIEPIAVLYTISSVFTDIYRVFSATDSGEKVSAVKEIYNYKGREFLIDKANQSLRSFDKKRIDLCLTALYEADMKLKAFSSDQRIVLEQLIIKLIYIIAKGESID